LSPRSNCYHHGSRIERDQFRFEYRDATILTRNQKADTFSIFQISDIQLTSASVCPVHLQECYEISYVCSGEVTMTVDDHELFLQRGDALLLRPGEKHSYSTRHCTQPARIYNLGFLPPDKEYSSAQIQEIFSVFDSSPSPFFINSSMDLKSLENLFGEMFKEASHQQAFWKYKLSLLLQHLILEVFRIYAKITNNQYVLNDSASSQQVLFYTVINYIDTNILTIRKISDITDALPYSYSHIAHVFKSISGISLREYWSKKRMDYAVYLLIHEDLKVMQVAEKLGYQSIHVFSKAFSKQYGMSPTKYVEQHQMR